MVRIVQRTGYTDRNGVHHEFNSLVDFPEALAAKLIGHGIAIAEQTVPLFRSGEIKEQKIETAAVAPPEQAARTTRPSGRKG